MQFYDAANWRNLLELVPGKPMCLYADGQFAVTTAQLDQLDPSRVRWITVTGSGRTASILDGRPDNPLTRGQVRGFVRDRRGADQDAIIYCPRSWVSEYLAILFDDGHGTLINYPRLYWWIATLDGKPWTAEELAADLENHWDAVINPASIWAVQNNQLPEIGPAALVDESELFLGWRP